MNRSRNLGLGLVLALVSGCGSKVSEPGYGGETHWLGGCASDATCGDGFECLCGVCTVACSSQAQCDDLASDAVCGAVGELDFASKCERSPAAQVPAKLCVRERNLTSEPETDAGPIETASATATNGTDADVMPSSSVSTDGGGPNPDVPCEERDLAGCDADGVCQVITGAPIDVQRACVAWSEPQALGCAQADTSCPPVVSVGESADGACYAFGGCVPAGFTTPSDGSTCSSEALQNECTTTLADGDYSWSLVLSPTFEDTTTGPASWWMRATLNVSDGVVTGWLAGSGATLSAGDEGYPATEPVTLGSVEVSGVVTDGKIVLEPVSVGFANSQSSTLSFDAVTLEVGVLGELTGTASGHWSETQGDQVFTHPFSGDLTGAEDGAGPKATARYADPLLPIDSLRVHFDEPVAGTSLVLTVEGGASTTSEVADERAGFVRYVNVQPTPWWEESVTLRVKAQDAAGNASEETLAVLPIAATPMTEDNPDFEQGSDAWLGEVTAVATNSTNGGIIVSPPEGSQMGLIPVGQRAVAHFTPGDAPQELCFQFGVNYSWPASSAFTVRLISSQAEVSQAFLLEDLMTPDAMEESESRGWTGFAEYCVALPEGAAAGVWAEFRMGGFTGMPFDGLIDAVTLR